MDNTKNALAELADDLRVMRLDVDGRENEILDKAQRIVAELAKVDTVPDGKGNQKTACFEGCDAVDRCRSIAEEGVR